MEIIRNYIASGELDRYREIGKERELAYFSGTNETPLNYEGVEELTLRRFNVPILLAGVVDVYGTMTTTTAPGSRKEVVAEVGDISYQDDKTTLDGRLSSIAAGGSDRSIEVGLHATRARTMMSFLRKTPSVIGAALYPLDSEKNSIQADGETVTPYLYSERHRELLLSRNGSRDLYRHSDGTTMTVGDFCEKTIVEEPEKMRVYVKTLRELAGVMTRVRSNIRHIKYEDLLHEQHSIIPFVDKVRQRSSR